MLQLVLVYVLLWNPVIAAVSMQDWFSTVLLGGLTLSVLGWFGFQYLSRGRPFGRDMFDSANNCRKRCREPAVFCREEYKFGDGLFSMEEALRTLQPEDPVGTLQLLRFWTKMRGNG